MDGRWIRTEMVLGTEGLSKIQRARVAVFGLGGVGGACAEALARGGIGRFLLVDHDTISLSNINRQILATEKTIGRQKADVMKERILEINPNAQVEVSKDFFLPGNDDILAGEFSYIVDAIDTVTAKIELALLAEKRGIPIVSSMGTGNKLDPSRFFLADIYETSVCPLAKVMRRELKKRGIKALKVVFSTEEPRKAPASCSTDGQEMKGGRTAPGSVSFVPPVAGLLMAGCVLREIAEV